MRKSLLGAALLLSAGGMMFSCSDELELDTKKPDFLGGSLYDELKKSGRFTNVTRMIDDLGLQEVLSKTGSRTLFVADDEAYKRFYEGGRNIWGVTKYEDLSVAQKKLLLNAGMLENSYLLEMMPNLGGDNGITKNQCLRQPTSVAITDSIPYFLAADLPRSYNAGEHNWTKYNSPTGALRPGMWLALDATVPMMTHFMRGQLVENNITDDDLAFVLGSKTATLDSSYIYNERVKATGQDVTCLNGYYNELENVLVNPQNMAEVIRTNGTTNIFSHMLDRFSAPFYNATLTAQFNALRTEAQQVDSVFEKRYFSERSQGGSALSTDDDGKTVTDLLSFDPGWNQYSNGNLSSQQDMGVMFVPNDAAMTEYFTTGGGRDFIERYAVDVNGSLEEKIDQIPLNIVKELINNLMKSSFNSSVPSKYNTIMNDARDRMFEGLTLPDGSKINSVDGYKQLIDKVLMANNGVVYVIKSVVTPAAYASVAGPVIISDKTRIMNSVITADDGFVQGSNYNNAPLQQYFSTYMKAMQSKFTLFVPTDESLEDNPYVDPMVYSAAGARRAWAFSVDETSKNVIPVRAQGYKYDFTNGIGASLGNSASSRAGDLTSATGGAQKKTLLIEMVNQHLVVHDQNDDNYVRGASRYYLSRSGAPVYIKNKGRMTDKNPAEGMQVQGGFQLWRNRDLNLNGTEDEMVSNVTEGYDKSNKNGYGNGYTLFIDKPLQATIQSVSNVMQSDRFKDKFSEFWKLAKEEYDSYASDVLNASGLLDGVDAGKLNSERLKYAIFETGNNYGSADATHYIVRMFNNYRYTVYVPTNESLQKAEQAGLPTWKALFDFVESHKDEEDKLSEEDKLKLQAGITYLMNFLRYHFQDNSVFVDESALAAQDYATASINDETKTYLSLNVSRAAGSEGHSQPLELRDQTAKKHGNAVSAKTEGDVNIFARDIILNNSYTNATGINGSSYSVIHQIDNVLNFDEDFGGDYNYVWNMSPRQAAAFVAKYRIRQ